MDDIITLSISDIVIIILLSITISFLVFRLRYWTGYRDGFLEGVESGTKNSLQAIDDFKKNGDLQEVIDKNLVKNPGFIKIMKDIREVYIQSFLLWKVYGEIDDPLDRALSEFRENHLNKEGPTDETQTTVV